MPSQIARAALLASLLATGSSCGGGTQTEASVGCPDAGGSLGGGEAGISGDAAADASVVASDSARDRDGNSTIDGAFSDSSSVVDGAVTDAALGDASSFCSTPPANQRVLQVAVGGGRSCAILSGGSFKCWGIAGLTRDSTGAKPGQMGDKLPFIDLGAAKTAVSVSLGAMHACVLLSDGSVKCFGSNSGGQLGVGDTMDFVIAPGLSGDKLRAVDLGTGKRALAVSAGYAHTCALLDDHSVKCWGSNAMGSLGLGDSVNRGGKPGDMGDNLPAVELGTGRTALAVSAGYGSSDYYQHTCALLDDHSIKCWGSNLAGELGQGDRTSRGDKPGQMGDSLPAIDLGTGRTALAVSAGYGFTCALLDDHSLKCWGSGDFLGLGRIDSRGAQPGQMGDKLPTVDLGTGKTALQVSAGYSSTCALLSGGSVKCWGLSFAGQLGLGDSLSRGTAPRQMGDYLPALDFGSCGTAAAVSLGNAYSGGSAHACVLLVNGTIKCWGAGEQLGSGDAQSRGDQPGQMGDALPTVKLFSSEW